jgi:hypothetical protein
MPCTYTYNALPRRYMILPVAALLLAYAAATSS